MVKWKKTWARKPSVSIRQTEMTDLFQSNDMRENLPSELNEGQKSAMLLMLRFIQKCDSNMFVLKGYAGTGKSFLIGKFINEVTKFKNVSEIAITAPTNKAVKVLKKISDRSDIDHLTIHKLLGLTQKIDARGKISFSADKGNKSVIPKKTLLLVDETSMLDDGLFDLLKEEVEKRNGLLRIIFIGDYAQIPPVNKGDCIPFKESLSQGYSEEGYTLRQVMRQRNENPIVSVAYNIRENLEDAHSTADVVTNMVSGDSGITVINKEDTLLLELGKMFKGLTNSDYAKVIAWTNQEVKHYNGIVRNMIFGNPSGKIITADKLIANTSISNMEGILYNTSDEFEVLNSVVKDKMFSTGMGSIQIRVYSTMVKEPGTSEINTIDILHEDSYNAFRIKLEQLKQRAKNMSIKSYWVDYYDFMKKIADVSYNYAVTAHKAQGSTYENVFVMEDNINSNKDVIERNRIKYTAYTRASKRLFIYKKV